MEAKGRMTFVMVVVRLKRRKRRQISPKVSNEDLHSNDEGYVGNTSHGVTSYNARVIYLILLHFRARRNTGYIFIRNTNVVNNDKNGRLLMYDAMFISVPVIYQTFVIVNAMVSVIFCDDVIMEMSEAGIRTQRRVRNRHLHDRSFNANEAILPLFIVVGPVMNMTAMAFNPRLTNLMVDKPMRSPRRIANLRRMVTTHITYVVVATFLNAHRTNVNNRFGRFPRLLNRIRTAKGAIRTIRLRASFILNVKGKDMVINVLHDATSKRVMNLMGNNARVYLIPVMMFTSAPKIIMLGSVSILMDSHAVYNGLMTVFIRATIRLTCNVNYHLFIHFTLATYANVIGCNMRRVRVLLCTNHFVIIHYPTKHRTRFNFRHRRQLTGLSFFNDGRGSTIYHAQPVGQTNHHVFRCEGEFSIFQIRHVRSIINEVRLATRLPHVTQESQGAIRCVRQFVPNVREACTASTSNQYKAHLTKVVHRLRTHRFAIRHIFGTNHQGIFRHVHFRWEDQAYVTTLFNHTMDRRRRFVRRFQVQFRRRLRDELCNDFCFLRACGESGRYLYHTQRVRSYGFAFSVNRNPRHYTLRRCQYPGGQLVIILNGCYSQSHEHLDRRSHPRGRTSGSWRRRFLSRTSLPWG